MSKPPTEHQLREWKALRLMLPGTQVEVIRGRMQGTYLRLSKDGLRDDNHWARLDDGVRFHFSSLSQRRYPNSIKVQVAVYHHTLPAKTRHVHSVHITGRYFDSCECGAVRHKVGCVPGEWHSCKQCSTEEED